MQGKRYSKEFKLRAVRQVVDRGYKVADVSKRLSVCTKSLSQWIRDVIPVNGDIVF